MPRNGSGVFSRIAGSTAIPQTTIESSVFNAVIDDLVADANAARPIVAGGTGQSTLAGLRQVAGDFATRAALVTWVSTNTPVVGARYTAAGLEYVGSSGATAIADLPGLEPIDATPLHFSADNTGVSDATAAVQNWLNWCEARGAFTWSAGRYRIDGTLTLPKRCTITGTKASYTVTATVEGTTLMQHGPVLFQGPNDLTDLKLSGLQFIYMRSASPQPFDTFMSLKAHQGCVFEDFNFTFYNPCILLERRPDASDTITTMANTYARWNVTACAVPEIGIGYEPKYTRHMGNGIQTVFSTGQVWPEQFDSSVIVLREQSYVKAIPQLHNFTQLVLDVDYTVSYPGGVCTVTMTNPPSTSERIHIWVSGCQVAGRKPITNNTFSEWLVQYSLSGGHKWVRWVDAEQVNSSTIILSNNFTSCVQTNPYINRTGEGGDFGKFTGCVFAYSQGATFDSVTNPSTLIGFDLGPGSYSMTMVQQSMDLLWVHGGFNRAILTRDGARVAVAGTVSVTAGSAIVTGTGTQFRKHFTKSSDVNERHDRIEIGGVVYQIASIDSATQITLATAAASTLTGVSAWRRNIVGGHGHQAHFAAIGTNFDTAMVDQGGRSTSQNRTNQWGNAVIPAGSTSVVVPHSVWRAPQPYEVRITPNTGVGAGIAWSVNPISATSLTINIPSALGLPAVFGWEIDLKGLN